MKNKLSKWANKCSSKFEELKNSDKKGMEILGWILTIVFGLGIVFIVWTFVRPAAQGVADDAASSINQSTTDIFTNVEDLETPVP